MGSVFGKLWNDIAGTCNLRYSEGRGAQSWSKSLFFRSPEIRKLRGAAYVIGVVLDGIVSMGT